MAKFKKTERTPTSSEEAAFDDLPEPEVSDEETGGIVAESESGPENDTQLTDVIDTGTRSIPLKGIAAYLEQRSTDLARNGDREGAAHLLHVATAAGALRQALQPVRGFFIGETGELIQTLFEIL